MKAVLQIVVKDEFDSILNTREAAKELLSVVYEQPCNLVELDFQDIEFISRSFADQLHKEKTEIQNTHPHCLVKIINANDSILNMLDTVVRTQANSNRKEDSFDHYQIADYKTLKNYFLGI